jgi:hypothetical protein
VVFYRTIVVSIQSVRALIFIVDRATTGAKWVAEAKKNPRYHHPCLKDEKKKKLVYMIVFSVYAWWLHHYRGDMCLNADDA